VPEQPEVQAVPLPELEPGQEVQAERRHQAPEAPKVPEQAQEVPVGQLPRAEVGAAERPLREPGVGAGPVVQGPQAAEAASELPVQEALRQEVVQAEEAVRPAAQVPAAAAQPTEEPEAQVQMGPVARWPHRELPNHPHQLQVLHRRRPVAA